MLNCSIGHRENFALHYEKRAKDSNHCPRSRDEEYQDYSIPSGITYFNKIRIDLHTLQIVENDFQFVHWNGRRNQTFGSAGDCYSTAGRCPQGRFSINLTGTKFRIRPKTIWETRGQYSSMVFSHKV